jgi:hypothetical protein
VPPRLQKRDIQWVQMNFIVNLPVGTDIVSARGDVAPAEDDSGRASCCVVVECACSCWRRAASRASWTWSRHGSNAMVPRAKYAGGVCCNAVADVGAVKRGEFM